MKIKDLREEKSALELEIFLLSDSRKTEDKMKIRKLKNELEKINKKLNKRI